MIIMWSWSHQAAASWSERRIGRYWTQMHGKLHHLHGLVAYHYSSLQFTGALVACSSPLLAAALLGLAAAGRLHEAEARAAGTLEQELHHA